MGYPHRDPWYVPTSYPLDESRRCTYKGYDVRTQQGSRGWYSLQGVQGDAVPLPGHGGREPGGLSVPTSSLHLLPQAARGGYRNSYNYLENYQGSFVPI